MTRDITGTVGITAHDQSDSPNAQNRMKLRRSHAVQKDSSTQDMTYHASSPQTAKAIGRHDAPTHQTRRQHAATQGEPTAAAPAHDATRHETAAWQPTRRTGRVRDEQSALVTSAKRKA